MGEDSKEVFKRMSAKRSAVNQDQVIRARIQTHRALAWGKRGRVCYYPVCGSDFAYPLRHFSDRCDTFVFCDWSERGAASFVDAMEEIKAQRPRRSPDDAPDFIHYPVNEGDVKELANMEQFLAKFAPELPPHLTAYLANPPLSKGRSEEHTSELQ